MMTYRIAFLTPSLSAKASGIRTVVESLSKELEQLGHEIRVFGEIDLNTDSDFPKNWHGAAGVGFSRQGPKNFGFSSQLYADVAAFKPHIVHLHGIWQYTSIVALMMKKRTGATLIVSPHGSLAKPALSQSNIRKKLALKLYQNSCFDIADALHTTAHSEAAEVREYTRNPNIAVIRNGVGSAKLTPPAFHMRANKILALCRMEPKKGLENLIQAWAAIESQRPSWSLEIVGPDRQAYRKRLVKYARKLSVKNLSIKEGVYGVERDDAFASSKLFILPSKNENFGMTVAESLNLGTPVIASRGSPWSGLEDHKCGWWVEHDTDSLAAAILVATGTPCDELMSMGNRGQTWMKQNFHWGQVAQEMAEFYKEMHSAQKANA